MGAETYLAEVRAFRVEKGAGGGEVRKELPLTEEQKKETAAHILHQGRLALTLSGAGLTVDPSDANPVDSKGKTFWTAYAEKKGKKIAVARMAPAQFDQARDPDKYYNVNVAAAADATLSWDVRRENLDAETLWLYATAGAGVLMMLPGLEKAVQVLIRIGKRLFKPRRPRSNPKTSVMRGLT